MRNEIRLAKHEARTLEEAMEVLIGLDRKMSDGYHLRQEFQPDRLLHLVDYWSHRVSDVYYEQPDDNTDSPIGKIDEYLDQLETQNKQIDEYLDQLKTQNK